MFYLASVTAQQNLYQETSKVSCLAVFVSHYFEKKEIDNYIYWAVFKTFGKCLKIIVKLNYFCYIPV